MFFIAKTCNLATENIDFGKLDMQFCLKNVFRIAAYPCEMVSLLLGKDRVLSYIGQYIGLNKRPLVPSDSCACILEE